MESIILASHGETIIFEQNHSQADEWRVRSSRNNGGRTNLTTEEVEEQVKYLKEKGFEQK
mgnify:CR=1 FL=1